MTYPQYLALLVLWQQDDVLVKDIGDKQLQEIFDLRDSLFDLAAKLERN